MSSGPSPEDTTAVTESELRAEDYIISQPLAPARVTKFREEFEHDRTQAAATEAIFRRAACFVDEGEWNDAVAYGIKTFLQKGPFVQGSNWLDYNTWDFALALERRLLMQMVDSLAKVARPLASTAIPNSWTHFQTAARELVEALPHANRPDRSAIVIAGPLESTYSSDWNREMTPRWEVPPELDRAWILGLFRDRPILHVRETEVPALYAVDLPAFGLMTAFDTIEFAVDDIDDERAEALLRATPALVKIRPGRPDTSEERIRTLRLSVELTLFESRTITPSGLADAVVSIPLEPGTPDIVH